MGDGFWGDDGFRLFFSGVEWLLCRGAGAGNEEKTGIGRGMRVR